MIWVEGGKTSYELVLSPQLVEFLLGGAKSTGTNAVFEIVGAGHVLVVEPGLIDTVVTCPGPAPVPPGDGGHPGPVGGGPIPVGGAPVPVGGAPVPPPPAGPVTPPTTHLPFGPINIHILTAP